MGRRGRYEAAARRASGSCDGTGAAGAYIASPFSENDARLRAATTSASAGTAIGMGAVVTVAALVVAARGLASFSLKGDAI